MIPNLTDKLAANYDRLPASVIDIVSRTRTVGLHKVAAQLRNKKDFGLEDVVRELGTKLAYGYLKQQKIASGLASLRDLHADNTVKLSGLLRLGPGIAKELIPAAKGAVKPTALGTTFGAAKRVEGPLTSATPAGMGFPKKTLRGVTRPSELPAMGPLPTKP